MSVREIRTADASAPKGTNHRVPSGRRVPDPGPGTHPDPAPV